MGRTLYAGERTMDVVEVSPEMVTLLGTGRAVALEQPPAAVAFVIDYGGEGHPASVTFHALPTSAALDAEADEERLILLVDPAACARLLGAPLDLEDGAICGLPADLRTIALAIRDCGHAPAAALPYRLAKSIELLCELLAAYAAGRLTALAASAALTLVDTRRIVAARQLIDQLWHEKLTLDQIARRCGLNRSKLARGFRQLYDCSVTEALAERRLAEARKQLIATDLPVGIIGFRSGYLNNASFTRAFGRRFGVSPSDYRACGIAA